MSTSVHRAQDYQCLDSLGLAPGASQFFQAVELTKQRELGTFNLACCWQRNYRQRRYREGWFRLSNLPTLKVTITAYQHRSSTEALFGDYKSGGYDLAGVRVSSTGLSALLLLIAIAYSSALIARLNDKRIHLQR